MDLSDEEINFLSGLFEPSQSTALINLRSG